MGFYQLEKTNVYLQRILLCKIMSFKTICLLFERTNLELNISQCFRYVTRTDQTQQTDNNIRTSHEQLCVYLYVPLAVELHCTLSTLYRYRLCTWHSSRT